MNKETEKSALALPLRIALFCSRALAVLFFACTLVMPVGYFIARMEYQSNIFTYLVLETVQSICALVVICYLLFAFTRRTRSTLRPALIAGISTLFLPLGSPLAFFLPTTLKKYPFRTNVYLILLHCAGFVINAWRDLQGWDANTSFLRTNMGDPGTPTAPPDLDTTKLILLIIAMFIAPIWAGLWQKAQLRLKETQERVEKEHITGTALQNEIININQRDNLARNIHDTIGRKLSLISLYAGGMEMAKENDPEVSEQARRMRETAQEAVTDLRKLVTMMRANDEEIKAEPPSLVNLSTLIEHSVQAKQKIISNISLQNLETAGSRCAEATYFIVAEILTNAAKHAPNSTLQLKITGNELQGIHISAKNELDSANYSLNIVDSSITKGYGLKGIAERVELLGGTVIQKTEAGYFKTHIWLPWK